LTLGHFCVKPHHARDRALAHGRRARIAKTVLMMLESAISMLTLVIVVSRAINVLPG
jgi:hypothetical protein